MSLIENFFTGFIDLIIKFLGTILSLIISPLLSTFNTIVPNLNSYLVIFGNFYIKLLKGVAFAKEVFLNTTGFPRELFYLVIIFFFGKMVGMVALRSRRFIFNLYYLIRGSKSITNKE